MSYGTYPSGRLAYDIDRTSVYLVSGGVAVDASAYAEDLNLFSTETLDSADRAKALVFVFPELRSMTYARVYTDGGGSFRYSYVERMVSPEEDAAALPWVVGGTIATAKSTDWRTGIELTPAHQVGAIRLDQIGATSASSGVGSIHLFGAPVNSDRVLLWESSIDQQLIPRSFDWRDPIQGSTFSYPFRVRNMSSRYTATDVVLSIADLGTPSTPPISAQHMFSADDESFYATLTIPSIGPSSVSDIVYMLRVISPSAELGQWPFRVTATVTSWE